MSEDWFDEEKLKKLNLPGVILPGLRDLKIYFIAFIEFDLFLGPVVYYKELRKGSQYIKKLSNSRTIAEIYGGLARSDLDRISNPVEDVYVFPYEKIVDNVETVSVLLISLIKNSDPNPIISMGSRVIQLSKGEPDEIGSSFANYMRDILFTQHVFNLRENLKFHILDDDRILGPLETEYFKGILIVDYESKLCDVRNLPKLYHGVDLDLKIISYVDKLSEFIFSDGLTSLFYKGIPFLAIAHPKRDVKLLFLVDTIPTNVSMRVNKLIIEFSKVFVENWKLTSNKQIQIAIDVLERMIFRSTKEDIMGRYLNLILRSSHICPEFNREINQEILLRPDYISKNDWRLIISIAGIESLMTIFDNWKQHPLEIITLLEWAHERNLIHYLEK